MPARIECRATARARWLAILSPAMILAGIWRIDGVLGALGVAGIALLVLGRLLGTANLRRLAVNIEAPHRATSGLAYPLRITLTNTRRLLDAVRISCSVTLPGGAVTRFHTPWIAAGSAVDFDGRATPTMRTDGGGIGLKLHSAFPLGLFSFHASATREHPMIVLPRPRVPRDSPGHGVRMDATPLVGATPGGLDGDLRGLRVWRAGDNPRRIAWPATMRSIARGAEPVVRENDPPGFLPRHCLLVVHSHAGGGALIRPDRFERTLELTSGWLERLHALGIHARLTADFDAWEVRPAHTRAGIIRCREQLARASRCASTEAHELHQALTRIATDEETVILLSDMPPEYWIAHLPHAVRPPVITKF